MNLTKLSVSIVAVLVSASAFSQHNATGSDSLSLTPSHEYTSKETTGTHTAIVNDTIARQIFNGVNVGHLLNGQIPNYSNGRSFLSSMPYLRNESPILLIDGLPFNNTIGAWSNLNTFNFKSIGVVSSGNGVAVYGAQGSSGAIVLETKSGENIHNAQFEANSTVSNFWMDATGDAYFVRERENRWMLNHAIAYAQDYGKADLRVSYINEYHPDGSSSGTQVLNSHAFKVNTGVDFTPRFSARLAGDFLRRSNRQESSDAQNESDDLHRGIAGNLLLRFKANEWLTLSSQSNLSKGIQKTDGQSLVSIRHLDNDQRRSMTNVMALFTPRRSPNFSITFSTGAQLERQTAEENVSISSSSQHNQLWTETKAKTRAWINHATIQSWQHLTVNLAYRHDYWVDAPDDDRNQSTYAGSVALQFADALKIRSSNFSAGTLRLSLGKTHAVESPRYPLTPVSSIILNPYANPGMYLNYYNLNLKPTTRNSLDAGFDLGFFDSRLSIEATYFNNHSNQTFAFVPFSTTTGFYYVLTNIGEATTSGVEAAIGYEIYRNISSAITVKAIYASYHYDLTPNNADFEMFEGAHSTFPDWTTSLLAQFRFTQLFGRLLFTHQSGGNTTIFTYPGNTIPIDYTQTWLRDVAFGYSFPHIDLSISGTNLWEIQSPSEEYELLQLPRMQKGVTVSASFRF